MRLKLRTLFILASFFLSAHHISLQAANPAGKKKPASTLLYNKIADSDLNFSMLDHAIEGLRHYSHGNQKLNDSLMVLIDFSKPSSEKRFFVVDIKNQTVLYKTYVAHGRNSGNLMAENFSNIKNSNMSSLGFFKSSETYHGKHGFSLRIDGLETGINDNARSRAVVIHSANYANPDFIKKTGRLGRSFGCPALPADKDYKNIVELIKGNVLIYAFANDPDYTSKSAIKNRMAVLD